MKPARQGGLSGVSGGLQLVRVLHCCLNQRGQDIAAAALPTLVAPAIDCSDRFNGQLDQDFPDPLPLQAGAIASNGLDVRCHSASGI